MNAKPVASTRPLWPWQALIGVAGCPVRAACRARRCVAHDRRPQDSAAIVAVVNGDVISKGDVDNRRRLFALSTGMPASPEVLDRLTPQVTRQLIDERLRLQEMQRRKIVVSDKDIAKAIGEVEARNNMPAGTLRKRADGRRRRDAHADRPDPRADRLEPRAAPGADRRAWT